MTSIADALARYAVIIVTGGSSGIGKAFIEQINGMNRAALICNLSRREPEFKLSELKLRHVPCDLSDPAQLERAATEVLGIVRAEAKQGKILLVNNSGFGGYGRSEELARAHQTEMIDVNVRALVDLTARLLPELKARGGAVVNIASTAAFQPTAFMAVYGATKAFVLHWSLALGEELRGSGVHVLAVCPGPTATEFFNRAGMKKGAVSDQWGQTSEQVVNEALRALASGRRQVVTGWLNWVMAAVSSRLPKPFGARVGAVVLAKFRMSKVNT
jgi:short-subunit dehydrogenase